MRKRLAEVHPEAASVGRNHVIALEWSGTPIVVAGTGYTGEDGVECAVPIDTAPAFWRALCGAGITPAGLGARDTLRLEAGLPLHGHELGRGITPLQAGLSWVVGWKKGDFRGRGPLEAERSAGVARRLRGIALDGRQPAREGSQVYIADTGEPVGDVTSGHFSPTLGHAIAFAFLRPDIVEGRAIECDVRGRRLAGAVTALPFVAKRA